MTLFGWFKRRRGLIQAGFLNEKVSKDNVELDHVLAQLRTKDVYGHEKVDKDTTSSARVCSRCKGRGVTEGAGGRLSPCLKCHGKVICPTCEGTGKVDSKTCSSCRGWGYRFVCPRCGGTGRITNIPMPDGTGGWVRCGCGGYIPPVSKRHRFFQHRLFRLADSVFEATCAVVVHSLLVVVCYVVSRNLLGEWPLAVVSLPPFLFSIIVVGFWWRWLRDWSLPVCRCPYCSYHTEDIEGDAAEKPASKA